MNNRKAFTLVELAIVIVIIGFLLTMTIKGRDLVEAAKIKSDIAKIRELHADMLRYVMDNDLELWGNGLTTARNHFNEFDTTLRMVSSTSPNLELRQAYRRADYFNLVNISTPDYGQKNTLVIVINIPMLETTKSPLHIGCLFDATVDDGNPNKGNVRFSSTGSVISVPNGIRAGSCDSKNTLLNSGSTYISYGYMLQ